MIEGRFFIPKAFSMVKKISSIGDIRKLVIGDKLLDHPEPEKAKTYTIRNITDGIIYAIYENNHLHLKVFSADNLSHREWWLLTSR
jgi:hypothetical protein